MALSLLVFWVVFLVAFVRGEVGSGSEKIGLYDDDVVEADSVKEMEKEFDYLYNMEMMERLVTNETKYTTTLKFMMIPSCLMCMMMKGTTMMDMMLKKTTTKTQPSLISF